MQECMTSDVLVIGCGIGGGIAALSAAEKGAHVRIITRADEAEETATLKAQGGIIFESKQDSPGLLAEDLLRAGVHFNNPRAVAILVEEGPRLVRELLVERLGVPFNKSTDGELATIREAAHSTPRIVHDADATGKSIEKQLMQAIAAHPRIEVETGCTAVDLLTPAHHARGRLAVYDALSCVGAYVFDQAGQTVARCLARTTILASGGLGQVFLRTSNPAGARGDGLAMAYRAGARVINCEFVQFHPTTFHRELAPNLLISEALRGAGARLVNAEGKTFMQNYDAEWLDLAPRDVVARSIHREMTEQGVPNVFLDLHSCMAASAIKESFPSIYRRCLEFNVDITRTPIPVVPAAHYFIGGVWVDEWGRSTIDRLYAVGETACTGVHGANRLGSASLLEGLVWGKRAADHIGQRLPSLPMPAVDDIPPWEYIGSERPDPVLMQQDMNSIRNIMWNYVGLQRSGPRLQRAIRELRHLESEIERFYRESLLNDELVGLRNAVRAALIIAKAARANKQSIGCHYRV